MTYSPDIPKSTAISTHSWLESSATVKALQPAATGQTVADKVHAPYLIDCPGQLKRHTLARRPLGFATLAHGQVRCAVQPVHLLVIDAREIGFEHVVNAAVAKASPLMSELDDSIAELLRRLCHLRRMSIAVAGEPHKTARPALRQSVFIDHLANRLALGLWG